MPMALVLGKKEQDLLDHKDQKAIREILVHRDHLEQKVIRVILDHKDHQDHN